MPDEPLPPPPTPVSETTFADRLQRGRDMQSAIALFTPPFDPADPSLAATPFGNFLDDLDDLNTSTATLGSSYTTGVTERMAMVKEIRDVVLRVWSYIRSNPAWEKFRPTIKPLVEKVRGTRAKKAKPPGPTETPGSPLAKRRNSGEQSFGEIATNFDRLIAALASVTGYAPTTAELTIAGLTARAAAYAAKNATMSTLGNSIGLQQRDRQAGFKSDGGLRGKMKAIKEAVRAQYGSDSAEYEQVKGIDL